jgi:hypothetical protein
MTTRRPILNRSQIILTGVVVVVALFVAIDYKSDLICRCLGLQEIYKGPREVSWYCMEWIVLAVCYAGLLYVLRTRSKP